MSFDKIRGDGMTEKQELTTKRLSLRKSKTGSNHSRVTSDQFDNHLSDSGFKSNCYQDKRKSNEKLCAQKMEVPHMLSFVGGSFTVQLYKKEVNLILSVVKPWRVD